MKTLRGVVSIVAVGFALVYFAADASAAVAFSPRVDYASTNPVFIAKGDLNSDGRTDLVVANWSSNTITVFLGNADGTFTAQTPVSTGVANSHPNSIATGYFNEDANLDLAVANGGGIRDIVLMYGDGLGGFSVTSLDVSVGGYPNGDADINYIVSGDFDSDGETDLALSKNTGFYPTINDHIKIMKGDGSGGFTPLSSTNVGDSATGPYGLATGYFNNDANLDLAVTLYDSGTLKILLGDGDGGFSEASGSPITVGTIPLFVVNADLNADGKADLIVTNNTSNSLSILLGNGDGTFTPASGSPVSTGTGPAGVISALINSDANPDLVVTNAGASTFSVFLGNGDGTFQAREDFGAGPGPGSPGAGDFNGDGKMDIAIANSSGNTISVFLQTQCTPPPSDMVSWWGGDNNALDIVGTNNGTLVNGATYAPGMVGQAFSFDGGNDYVSVPHSSAWNFGSNNFTIDLWVEFNAIKSNFLACHDEGVGNQNKWCFYADHDYLNFHINSPGTGPISIGYGTVPFPYNTGQWYHLALTRNGNTYTFYVDGAPAGTVTDSNVIPDANAPLTIGQGEGVHYVNGLIDELEIFNRALSAEEIAAIYNAGSTGKCRSCTPPPSNLLSWWPFEEGIGATTADIIGANDGTVYGAAWAAGKVGSALSFDGVDDYADMGNSNDFNFGSGDFAISFWAKPGNGGGGDDYDHVIGKAATTSLSPYLIGIHGSEWGFWSSSNGSSWDIAQKHVFGGITLNSWQYIVITRAGTAINFYINGVQTTTLATSAGLWSNTEKLLIGKIPWTAQDTHYKGLLDEVEIFNRALSAEEIAAIYNAGSAGQCEYAIGTNTPANGTIVCNTPVASGYDAVCTITPDTGYYLSALTDNGGDVLGDVVAGIYTISGVAENHDVVATFAGYPVWRGGPTGYFMTLGEAYGDGSTDYTIKARGAELTDSNLNLAGTAAVVIDGGYLSDFGGYSGVLTTITGPLTIGGTGSVAISRVAVK